MSRLAPLLFALTTGCLLTACGAELEGTGVWRQICDEQAPEPCDGSSVYELHLGRYGDQISGLIARYPFENITLEPFQRTNECGCFLITGGRITDDSSIGFTLYAPENPGIPNAAFEPVEACAPSTEQLPPECPDLVFELEQIDGHLDGTVSCGQSKRQLRFRRVAGRPRTECQLR